MGLIWKKTCARNLKMVNEDEFVMMEHVPQQRNKIDILIEQVRLLRREVADIRNMMRLSDIRKREEYLRRGISFPFTPEQSKYRPGTYRPTSIL